MNIVRAIGGSAMDKREQRFRDLYEEARPRVLRYVTRRCMNSEDAAEIIAETFTIAWRRIDDVPAGADGVLWLFGTARNLLSNERRRAQRRSETVERLGTVLARGQIHAVDPIDEDRLRAASLLARLSPDEQEILMLATWEGLTSEELATTLGCSSIAARLRLHRARSRLNREMKVFDRPKQDPALQHEVSNAEQTAPGRRAIQ
jgi:RNA polymerase sigma factor (sigma-70 family)